MPSGGHCDGNANLIHPLERVRNDAIVDEVDMNVAGDGGRQPFGLSDPNLVAPALPILLGKLPSLVQVSRAEH